MSMKQVFELTVRERFSEKAAARIIKQVEEFVAKIVEHRDKFYCISVNGYPIQVEAAEALYDEVSAELEGNGGFTVASKYGPEPEYAFYFREYFLDGDCVRDENSVEDGVYAVIHAYFDMVDSIDVYIKSLGRVAEGIGGNELYCYFSLDHINEHTDVIELTAHPCNADMLNVEHYHYDPMELLCSAAKGGKLIATINRKLESPPEAALLCLTDHMANRV